MDLIVLDGTCSTDLYSDLVTGVDAATHPEGAVTHMADLAGDLAFTLTIVHDRELTDAEAARLPAGWLRNARQHHYVQAPSVVAASPGAACDQAVAILQRCAATPLESVWIWVRRAGASPFTPDVPTPPGRRGTRAGSPRPRG